MNDLIGLDGQLSHLRADADRIAQLFEDAGPSTAVSSCPGWDLHALVTHLGFVHRWANAAVITAQPPTPDAFEMPPSDLTTAELANWLRDGADALCQSLADADLDAPTWHPFPLAQVTRIWPRRQMIETAVHRCDAEAATGIDPQLDAQVAAMGLQEFFDLALPRVFDREGASVPLQSLHLHCTDDDLPDGSGEWIMWGEDNQLRVEAVHRKGDAALRGSASDLLLVMTGRRDRSSIDVVGDVAAVDAWLGLPGL